MERDKEIKNINIDEIIPNRFQPRLSFEPEALKELSESIKQYGVFQPLVVRRVGSKYEIIAGERRYKASTMAGFSEVPCVIVEMDDNESAEVALVENLQRKDLTAIEEAKSYQKLLERGYVTQDQLAKRMGKSQSSVANKIRLLNLDESIQQALLETKISERHARSLLSLKNKEDQKQMLEKIIEKRMTVKDTDVEVKKMLNELTTEAAKDDLIQVNVSEIAKPLSNDFIPFVEEPKIIPAVDFIPFVEEKSTNEAVETSNLNIPTIESVEAMPTTIDFIPFAPMQNNETTPVNSIESQFNTTTLSTEEEQFNVNPPVVEDNNYVDINKLINPESTVESKPDIMDLLRMSNPDEQVISQPEPIISDTSYTLSEIPTISVASIPIATEEISTSSEEEIGNFESNTFEEMPTINSDNSLENKEIPLITEVIETPFVYDNPQQPSEYMPEESIPEVKEVPTINTYVANNLRTAINTARECVATLEKYGFNVEKEELDLEKSYQIVIKIAKTDN